MEGLENEWGWLHDMKSPKNQLKKNDQKQKLKETKK